MKLIGANPDPGITGQDELLGKSNYFVGNDPEKWRTDVVNFAKVRYHNVYPGVDLIYYGNQRQLEFDFVVAPGADPKRIAMNFEGVEKLRMDGEGNLVLKIEEGEIRQQKPIVYQEIEGVKKFLEGRYVLTGENGVGFEVGIYDLAKPLVIDPVLIYSTYLGGAKGDFPRDIAVDQDGNAYIIGQTRSEDFPGAAGGLIQPKGGFTTTVFVSKINADATQLIYSTYLGGFVDDYGNGIAVDSSGNAYITGTSEGQFPTTQGAYHDCNVYGEAFVTKINPKGNKLVYSTCLGARSDGYSVAVDSNGNAYVGGGIGDANFAGAANSKIQSKYGGGARDGFVTKVNPSGTGLVFFTYLGGQDDDTVMGLALDPSSNIYVTGTTRSGGFPGTAKSAIKAMKAGFQSNLATAYDAFVTKMNVAKDAMVYSTYLGGTGLDQGLNVAADKDGNAYVTGETSSDDFPGTAKSLIKAVNTGLQQNYGGGQCTKYYNVGNCPDAFVAKVSPDGSQLVYSTYLGGAGGRNNTGAYFGYDSGNGITVDKMGNAYVTGSTNSDDFPGTSKSLIKAIETAPQDTHGGGTCQQNYQLNPPTYLCDDAFVIEINAKGTQLIYSTYLGKDKDDAGNDLALDSLGHTMVVGRTAGHFPTTRMVHQENFGGGETDAFIAKIGCPLITFSPQELPGGVLGQAYSEKITASGGQAPYTFRLVGLGKLPPGLQLMPNGTISGIAKKPGNYIFTVAVTDAEGCAGVQTYELFIEQPTVFVPREIPKPYLGDRPFPNGWPVKVPIRIPDAQGNAGEATEVQGEQIPAQGQSL